MGANIREQTEEAKRRMEQAIEEAIKTFYEETGFVVGLLQFEQSEPFSWRKPDPDARELVVTVKTVVRMEG